MPVTAVLTLFSLSAFQLFTLFSLSARTAEVASKLMHDVETNPGPCSGVSSFVRQELYTYTSYIRSTYHFYNFHSAHLHFEHLCQYMIFKHLSGTLPWCGQTWSPVWSSPLKHQLGSSRETFCRLNLLLRWCSTLHHHPCNSNPSVHRPGVSRCWRHRVEDCAGSTEPSGRDHLGGPEQTLHCREAWRTSTRIYYTW